MPYSLQTSPGETAALRWKSVEQPVQSETNHPSALSHHVRPGLLTVTILPDEFNSCTITSHNPLTLIHHIVPYLLQVLKKNEKNILYSYFYAIHLFPSILARFFTRCMLNWHYITLISSPFFILKSIHISDINNNDNNLFYIASQQQLYELLALYRSTNAIKHINMLVKLA